MPETAGGTGAALDATVKTDYTAAELEELLSLRRQADIEHGPAERVRRMRDKLARAEAEVELAKGYLAEAEAVLKGGD